jgi:hypothetical protein
MDMKTFDHLAGLAGVGEGLFKFVFKAVGRTIDSEFVLIIFGLAYGAYLLMKFLDWWDSRHRDDKN